MRHRISSYDTTGGNAGFCRIEAGEKRTLREIDGSGCIKHFWMTLAIPQDDYCRRIIIRMYWDDGPSQASNVPSVFFWAGAWHA